MKIAGRKKYISQAHESSIDTGLSFEESLCGTNAVHLAMKLNSSFLTLPENHYCNFIRDWYIFAVPLRIQNRLIGCISIIAKENCINQELALIAELLSYKISNELREGEIKKSTAGYKVKLTKKQTDVLKVLATGCTDKCAACELGISLGTVRYHKTNIFKNLNVESCIQAVVKALKLEILSLDDIEM
ncbi:MAG TPA: LuxR C-terminal-related transcriptional regulator [Ruminiclostridium sp.]|nr:LuxR C-terminal-related transcriptional regulator [Ruminiclostridium sp.]